VRFLPLILANLLRKKVRTALTIGSFGVALFLFGVLAVVRGAFRQGIDVAGADRLVVVNKVSIIQPLPLAYREQIRRIPGVNDLTFDTWFGGVYQDEKNFIPQFAVDADVQRRVFPEMKVPDDQWKAFVADRQGAIAGEETAKRFGWKIGDRIPIIGTIFPGVWQFNLRGIYTGARPDDDRTQFWFHYEYLEEKRQWGKGMVGWYTVKIDNPDDAARIGHAIDERFTNSPYETKTETEKAFATSFVKQAGNIELLILAVGGVVFFTLLLVTGNTMAIAVRERVGEMAILKALGFADRFLLLLVLGEALLISVVGAAVGLCACKLFTLGGDPTHGMLPFFYLPPFAVAAGLGLAVAVGACAAILPAVSAMRLRVADALRRV
jgi:putative ABC transport system permease protein